MSNPTKILVQDLDADLIKLIEELLKFKGTYTTIYDRLMNLTSDTFTDEIQAIIDDLLNGYQNGSIHATQRIENIRLALEEMDTQVEVALEEIKEQMEALQAGTTTSMDEFKDEIKAEVMAMSLGGGNFQEAFAYDADYGNVVKHIVTGDQAYTIDYLYKDMASGELSHSIQTITNEAGDITTIRKDYSYDASGNIVGIQTATSVVMAEAKTTE